MVLLETGHDAQVGLTLWTMIFRFSPQNATVRVRGVPAVVAAQGWTLSGLGAVAELVLADLAGLRGRTGYGQRENVNIVIVWRRIQPWMAQGA